MNVRDKFELILKAARNGDKKKVREYFKTFRLSYRDVVLYIEAFYNDHEAIELIKKESHCQCGEVATNWKDGPKCGNCSLQELYSQITFG